MIAGADILVRSVSARIADVTTTDGDTPAAVVDDIPETAADLYSAGEGIVPHMKPIVRAARLAPGTAQATPELYRDERITSDDLDPTIRGALLFLVRDYPCLLRDDVFNRLIELIVQPSESRDPTTQNRDVLLNELRNPPFEWFVPYRIALDCLDKASTDGRGGAQILELAASLRKAERKGYFYGGILNVSKGCSVQCRWCYTRPSARVQNFPWPWLVEVAALFKPYGRSPTIHHFDGDPLRDYCDPLYRKNYADVVALLPPDLISTAGFDIGSEGEKAAKRIKTEHPHIGIRVTVTLESAWARRIGRDAYVAAMRNVVEILRPNEIALRFSELDERGMPIQAIEVFKAIFGREPGYLEGEHIVREGRADRLAGDRLIVGSDKSVHCVFGTILNPDGSIEIITPEGNSFRLATIIKPDMDRYRSGQLEKLARFI